MLSSAAKFMELLGGGLPNILSTRYCTAASSIKNYCCNFETTATIDPYFLLKFINCVDIENQLIFKNLFWYLLNMLTKFLAINPAYALQWDYQLGVLLSCIVCGKGSTLILPEKLQLKFCATNPTANSPTANSSTEPSA